MEHIGVYEEWSAIHLAYLRRCDRDKLPVLVTDLDSIERNHADSVHDPLFIEYRRRAAAGLLRRRPGPKPLTMAGRLRLWAARFVIEDETSMIWEGRRAGVAPRDRSDMPPCLQAAELVSRRFGLNLTPEALLNKLSRAGVS